MTDAIESLKSPLQPSDVRLKTDIRHVGTTVYGLPLYHFRYKRGTACRLTCYRSSGLAEGVRQMASSF